MKFREMYKQREKTTKGKEPLVVEPTIAEERSTSSGTHSADPTANKTEIRQPSVAVVSPADSTEHDKSLVAENANVPSDGPDQQIQDPSTIALQIDEIPVIATPETSQPSVELEPKAEKQNETEDSAEQGSLNEKTNQTTMDDAGSDTPLVSESSHAVKARVSEDKDDQKQDDTQQIFFFPQSPTSTVEQDPLHGQSSPTSIQESLEPTSTRPTSVSEVSEKVASEFAGVQSLKNKGLTDSSKTAALDADEPSEPDLEESPLETSQTTPTLQTPAIQPNQTPKSIPIEPQNADSVSLIVPLNSDKEDWNPSLLSNTSATNKAHLSIITDSVDKTASTSSMEYDDDLLNELSSAEVQEATPVSVSKSPITAFFSRKANLTGFRAFSSPQNTQAKPDQAKAITTSSPIARLRSISSGSAVPTPRSTGENAPATKKRVGGGIAAKIADLQRSFSQSSPTNPINSNTPVKSVAQRASVINTESPKSVFTPPKRMSSLFPLKKQSTPPGNEQSTPIDTPSPPRYTSHPIQQPSIVTSSPTPEKVTDRSAAGIHPQSVTVRATIVRPNNSSQFETSSPPAGLGLELHSSPVTVSHHQRARSTTSSRNPFHPSARSASVSSLRSSPSSPSTEFRDMFSFRRSGEGWRSFGTSRRKSVSKSPPPTALPRNISNSSLDTFASTEEAKTAADAAGKQKQSRTSRLLKRMSSSISSIAGGNRMQLQTLNEKSATGDEELRKVETEKPKGIVVGDLNVQFPDTLVRLLGIGLRQYRLLTLSLAVEETVG
jgi:hypothetical protein